VQAWQSHEGTQQYKNLGADLVMKITDAESEAASAEEASLAEINNIVEKELDRQRWRGEMAAKAHDYYNHDSNRGLPDVAGTTEQGIPLPPIQRDSGFKQGGWVASAAQQRRAKSLDGGIAVTKLRRRVDTLIKRRASFIDFSCRSHEEEWRHKHDLLRNMSTQSAPIL
jgi:hypothetical protein